MATGGAFTIMEIVKQCVVLGRGYLGSEFDRNGFDVLGRDRFNIRPYGMHTWTLQWSLLKKYDVIINCIAKSNTRWCENSENFEEALWINGYFPKILSKWCKENCKKMVQISTGCLYDKSDPPQTEEDFLVTHCNYTITKKIGEIWCDSNRDLILRPRLLFSDIPNKNNLLCKLPKFQSYIADKKDSFSSTKTVVESTVALLEADQSGIFNICERGSASICDLAEWCGMDSNKKIKAAELRYKEGLYLVNNVMSNNKLLDFYKPNNIKNSIINSWNKLKGNIYCKDE